MEGEQCRHERGPIPIETRLTVSGRHRLSLTVALLLSVLVSACANKDEPSAANFERAINKKLAEMKLCTRVSPMEAADTDRFLSQIAAINSQQAGIAQQVRTDLPAAKTKIIGAPLVTAEDMRKESERTRILSALGAGGLLHGGGTYQYKPISFFSVKEEVGMLNEQGMGHYVERVVKNPFVTEKVSQICYGNVAVNNIVRWTAPADLMGHRVVNVEYTLKAADIADWAKPMLQHLEQSNSRKALLVLTNEGWSVDASSQLR
jgi:hypothetical protein